MINILYIDPSVVTYIVQIITGSVIAVGAAIGIFIKKIKKNSKKKTKKKEKETNDLYIK